jgi:hypothetical protein
MALLHDTLGGDEDRRGHRVPPEEVAHDSIQIVGEAVVDVDLLHQTLGSGDVHLLHVDPEVRCGRSRFTGHESTPPTKAMIATESIENERTRRLVVFDLLAIFFGNGRGLPSFQEQSHMRHSERLSEPSPVGAGMNTSAHRLIGAVLFAGLWIVVAGIRPTSTYHLAPLIVAAWPALGERDLQRAVSMSLFGAVLTAATTALLFSLGWLGGPSLLPWGGAGVESLVAGAAGALFGVVPAALVRLSARRA